MTQTIHLGAVQRWPGGARLPLDRVPSLVATAARAPSLHNTQPWRFRTEANAVELWADSARVLRALDPAGREALISCGAALFGLRLAVRQLGLVPAVSLLPDPDRPDLLARVYLGARAPVTAGELRLFTALPHRHTHRGPFSPEPLPLGLFTGLQHDAVAEGAALVPVGPRGQSQRLTALVIAAGRWQRTDRAIRAEMMNWTREPGDLARDGVPAWAYPPSGGRRPREPDQSWLPLRDFDLGRGQGLAAAGGPPPAATAILVTAGDTPADWLRAGQALHRLLADAASRWVFASLSSQPLESRPLRAMLRRQLRLGGAPQMVLQLGRAHTTEATARRPVRELISLP